jgi:enoyl-CoA hydratase/carnithine racemase
MSAWTVEQHDSVGVLTFSRPPSNLMDVTSMIELGDRLESFAAQPETVKVVLLASGNDDVFINHAELTDLTRAGQGIASQEELRVVVPRAAPAGGPPPRALSSSERSEKPRRWTAPRNPRRSQR